MFLSVFRWLRGRVRRPIGLALAALLPTLGIGGLFWYEATSPRPWEYLLRRGELTAGNFLRKHGRPAELRPDLVFLGVDDATLKLDGLWPEEIEGSRALQLIHASKGFEHWPREIQALVLDRLVSAGARLVIFDMVFPNPGLGDDALRAALDRHRGQALVGASFTHTEIVSGTQVVRAVHDDSWQGPSPTLVAEPADDPRVGYVNYKTDLDGAVRTLFYRTTQAAYNGRRSQPDEPVYRSLVAGALKQIGREDLIPAGLGPKMFRYTRHANDGDYPAHPLWEIFSDDLWKQNYRGGEFFRDKIVIVGAASAILHDVISTPAGEIPGPALHLQALGAALNRDYLTMPGRWTWGALFAGAGVLAWVVGVRVRPPLWRLGTFAAVGAAFLGVLQWLYSHGGLMPLAFTPLLIFGVGGLGGLVGEYAVERAEKARVRGVLDRLVSKDIVRELLRDRDRYAQLVRGQRRPVTVLFSDVRGFTTLSEKAEDPAAFIAQLNEYLAEMVDAVFQHRGTLDKFIGDAVMAVWGSMHTEGEGADACQAVAAALEMRARLAALNARWTLAGKMTLSVGIGVNFGEVIVGGLGSENSKMEITVMGDAVNTASRLEGLTKDYGVDLLVGEGVAARVSETFRLRTVDRVQVMGKTRPTEVMTVVGPLADTVAPEREEALADYEDAILRYRRRDFAGAAELLENCLRATPDDRLAALYLDRCKEWLVKAPAEGWDGVRLMTTK